VLATPLTVCLVVAGRHVERLKFLEVMLGDRPPLTPPQLVYQRMLAGDPIEAAEQAHECLKTTSIEDYCDTILLEGLKLAEADRRAGRLDDERLDRIAATVDELMADLEAYQEERAADAAIADISSNPGAAIAIEQARVHRLAIEEKSRRSILLLPGSGKLDEAAAVVLAHLIRHRGIGAAAEKADALSISKLFSLDLTESPLACVCYIGEPSTAKIQHTVRRLNKKSDDARIVVAVLGTDAAVPLDNATEATVIGSTFRAALEALLRINSEQRDIPRPEIKGIAAT